MPFEISINDLLDSTHASKPRNKLIAQVFFDMGMIERYGGGIQRILEQCKMADLPELVFQQAQGGLRVHFLSAAQSINGGVPGGVKSSADLLALIKTQPGQNAKQLAIQIDMPRRTIERWLNRLKNERQVEFRRSPKTGGYWPCAE